MDNNDGVEEVCKLLKCGKLERANGLRVMEINTWNI